MLRGCRPASVDRPNTALIGIAGVLQGRARSRKGAQGAFQSVTLTADESSDIAIRRRWPAEVSDGDLGFVELVPHPTRELEEKWAHLLPWQTYDCSEPLPVA